MQNWKRREFLQTGSLGLLSLSSWFTLSRLNAMDEKKPRFEISLAQWSLHKALFSGELNHLDFAEKSATAFGIYAVEYVNQFFKDKASDPQYLAEMNTRAHDAGVYQHLIMVDGEGGLAEPDEVKRKEAIENHFKWIDAAQTLGCRSVRVNAYGTGNDPVALHAAAVDGLGRLAAYAKPAGINVIVENHGGLSSDGQWLSGVMKEVGMSNCGTLPDFGNFCIVQGDGTMGHNTCYREYDRYQGVEEMLPYAKAISAKSYDFDASGHETIIDYGRMMKIIKSSSYRGYLGIEYEGSKWSEEEGILATKKLLETLIG